MIQLTHLQFVVHLIFWAYSYRLRGVQSMLSMTHDASYMGKVGETKTHILIYFYKFAVNRLKTDIFSVNVPLKLISQEAFSDHFSVVCLLYDQRKKR